MEPKLVERAGIDIRAILTDIAGYRPADVGFSGHERLMKIPTNPKMRTTAPIIDATIATYFKSKSSADTTRPLSNPVSASSIDQIPGKTKR